jgi:hypothetical protein
VRPRFFAGQLLTEDDLGLLADYVVAKNRLHNRALYGDGVVCGLEITCDPCKPGSVVAQPGLALDCCGNDLFLACRQELDINQMIRELRIKNSGSDCGDPCAQSAGDTATGDTSSGGTSAGATARGGEAVSAVATGALHVLAKKGPRRTYCLYARYDERLTEPVTPYATDSACGQLACEPTRVVESIKFELRCRTAETPPQTILDRVKACMGDPGKMQTTATAMIAVQRTARQHELAKTRLQTTVAGKVPPSYFDELKTSTDALTSALQALGDPSKAGADQATVALEAAATTGSKLAALNLYDEGARAEAWQDPNVLLAAATLAGNQTRLKAALAPLKEPLAQDAASGALDLIQRYSLVNQDLRDNEEARLFQAGMIYNEGYASSASAQLSAVQQTLLDKLDAGTADCALRDMVAAVTIPQGQTGPKTLANADAFSKAATTLSGALLRYAVDCMCAAMNPPCSSCDDTGVLLACIEVQDCRVLDICNLERKFVLSGTALRYWVPTLSQLGSSLEKKCCTQSTDLSKLPGLLEGQTVPYLFSPPAPATELRRATSESLTGLVPIPDTQTSLVPTDLIQAGIAGQPNLDALGALTSTLGRLAQERQGLPTAAPATPAQPDIAGLIDQKVAAAADDVHRRIAVGITQAISDKGVDQLGNRLDAATAQVATFDARIATAEQTATAAQQQLAATQASVTAFDGRLGKLEDQASKLTPRVSALEQAGTTLDARVAAVEKSTGAFDGRIAAAEGHVAAIPQQIQDAVVQALGSDAVGKRVDAAVAARLGDQLTKLVQAEVGKQVQAAFAAPALQTALQALAQAAAQAAVKTAVTAATTPAALAPIIDDRVRDVRAVATDANAKVVALDARTAALESGATKLDGRVSAMEASAAKLDGRVANVEAASAQAQSHLAKVEGLAGGFDTRIGALEKGATDMAQSVSKVTDRVKTVEGYDDRIKKLESGAGPR